MTKTKKDKRELRGKARLRAEIVEMTRALHKVGAVSDAELEKTTLRMLGRDAFPKPKALSADEIAAVRERAGVSQSVMAGYLNVAASTVSQWERGERRPTGTALKLLHVVKSKGLEPLR
jgi:putative transcriptional regulator